MHEIFKKYKLELEDHEIEKFEKFLQIFTEKNAQINLSAIREDGDIIEKHFIDSIMLNVFLELSPPPKLPSSSTEPPLAGEGYNVKVADMWTGWWFPLIPLAIINPEVQFTGIDSVGKKLKAVDDFAQQLELNNITTLNGRAEDIWQNLEHREQYDFITSRATAYFPTLLEYVIPLLKVGGIFIAYKLDDKEELKSAKKALSRLSAKIYKIKNYTLGDQKRTLVLIEKLQPTQKKYPRKIGIPLANPLK